MKDTLDYFVKIVRRGEMTQTFDKYVYDPYADGIDFYSPQSRSADLFTIETTLDEEFPFRARFRFWYANERNPDLAFAYCDWKEFKNYQEALDFLIAKEGERLSPSDLSQLCEKEE